MYQPSFCIPTHYWQEQTGTWCKPCMKHISVSNLFLTAVWEWNLNACYYLGGLLVSVEQEVLEECQDMNWGSFKPLLTDALVDHLHPIQVSHSHFCISHSRIHRIAGFDYWSLNNLFSIKYFLLSFSQLIVLLFSLLMFIPFDTFTTYSV